jgi:hypothetical protein
VILHTRYAKRRLNGFDIYAYGRYENGTAYPGYMKQVPTSIDYISCDIYETWAQSVDPKRGGAICGR